MDDGVGRHATFAGGMAEPASADIVMEIENHVVVVIGAGPHGYGIKVQLVADFPGNDVIGAGGVATEPETSDYLSLTAVQRQAATENDDSPDGFTDHWVIVGPE